MKTLKFNIMIESNSLGIGNYVTVANDKREQIRKVEGIGHRDMIWLANDLKTYFTDELAGIKLTEKWLKDLGFNYGGGISRKNEEPLESYYLRSVVINYNPESQKFFLDPGGFPLSYVHQLQNVLSPRLPEFK